MLRRDRRRGLACAAACLIALAAGGCGEERVPVRVGVLVDCQGLLGSARDVTLAAASLPLVEQGGKPAPHGSVTGAAVAGRRVQIVPACTEFTYFAQLVLAVRGLVEVQHVDVVMGPFGSTEGVVLRRLAARYPDITFLAGPGIARETTLVDPQPNLFRFTADGAQSVAGLGTYAYRELGWRSAVVVSEDWSDGWEAAAGFVTEFCALGGSVVERDWTALLTPDPTAAAARHAASADGVALVDTFASPVPYLLGLAAAQPDLAHHLVLGGAAVIDPAWLAAPGLDTGGVMVGSAIPLLPPSDGMAALDRALARAYPSLSTAGTLPPVLSYYVATSALVQALQAAGGELGDGQATLRARLSSLAFESPTGPLRLDANRQAIVRTYLDRIVMSPDGPTAVPAGVVDDVDQAFGGAITASAPQPNQEQPACRAATPPPWAR